MFIVSRLFSVNVIWCFMSHIVETNPENCLKWFIVKFRRNQRKKWRVSFCVQYTNQNAVTNKIFNFLHMQIVCSNSHFIYKFKPVLSIKHYQNHHGFKSYRKFPKYSDTQTICCNHSKIWTMWLYHRVMSPNDADGMANSVDPVQTAPLGAVWSGSALFAQAYLSENLGSLR